MKFVLFFLLLLSLAFLATSSPSLAQNDVTINGSEHPELIPDAAAVQAVLGVHSNFKTSAAIANTEKLHAKIGFSAADHAIYDAAMQALFNARRQGATATYANLLTTLSPDGQAKLKAFIQSEKAHMQYHTQEPIPQEVSQ